MFTTYYSYAILCLLIIRNPSVDLHLFHIEILLFRSL